MSLLLENALDAFDPADARLVGLDTFGDDRVLDDPLALDVVEGYAKHYDELDSPDGDAVRLPLHGETDAELTGSFVLYQEHDLRGAVFGGRGDDGTVEWVSADSKIGSSLAFRLRFWHPDYVPDSMPTYHVSPVEAVERARNPLESPEEFLDSVRSFIEEERATEREANRERAIRTAPSARYRDDGSAIPALEGLGADDGEFRFRVRDAPEVGLDVEEADWRGFVRETFGIHEGNEVLIHPPDSAATDDFPVRAEVVSLQGRDLRLAVAWESVESRTAVSGVLSRPREGYGLSPLLNPVPYDREVDATGALEGTELAAVFAGREPLTFEDDAKAASDPFDDDLNQDQHLAVEHALLADRLFCVHGPPGTGKTRTLVEFVRRSVQAGRDVLVCADSNQAVDNLLAGSSTADDSDTGSLHAYGQHGSDEFVIYRGNARRSANALVRNAYGDVSVGNAEVVVTTNSSAARLDRDFDVLVLDEATQATCASSCVPLARAEKVVLAGDHQQLPPYSATEDPAASSYGHSLFEHVYAAGGVYEGVGVQLRTQYRMHRDIAYLPNRLFYDKALRNGRTVPPLPDLEAIEAHSLGGTEERIGHSWRNPTEAKFVHVLVDRLLEQGLAADEIGIIAPYSAQVDLITDRLADHPAGDGIVVDSIDSFQGSEREAIVISFVRSNEAGDVGFLGRGEDGLRRLNVAMTRAKRHCSLVGDWDTLRGHTRETPTHGCVETYRELYRDLRNSGRVRKPDPALILN